MTFGTGTRIGYHCAMSGHGMGAEVGIMTAVTSLSGPYGMGRGRTDQFAVSVMTAVTTGAGVMNITYSDKR